MSAVNILRKLTIFRATELKPMLLADPAPVVIDLSDVTAIDCAGVQLLTLAYLS